jgi:hypothetical protein
MPRELDERTKRTLPAAAEFSIINSQFFSSPAFGEIH